jgi:hypothetical protein
LDLNASDGIQIGVGVVLTLTLGAVLLYAREARNQAKASAKMADEMVEARHGNVLPVLDFFTADDRGGGELLAEAIRILAGVLPENFPGRLKNIGFGPALDVKFQIKLEGEEATWQHVHRVEKEGHALSESVPNPSPDWYIYLEPVNGLVKRLRVEYNNVYGRPYCSWREVTFDTETGGAKVGHLHTEPNETP